MQADLLLIDEVLGVGDTRFRAKAIAVMQEKIAGEQSVVFVSHSGKQVKQLCDRVLWLEKGEIAGLGETNHVFQQYQNFINETEDLIV